MNKKDFQINIPEPCHEDWNEMTPKEKGRFCASCSKIVVDFSRMEPEEIKNYLITKTKEKVCGHFRRSQVDHTGGPIPGARTFTEKVKYFIYCLLLCFGISLFKNINAQSIMDFDKLNGTVADTFETEMLLGDVMYVPEDSLTGDTVYIEPMIDGEIEMVIPNDFVTGRMQPITEPVEQSPEPINSNGEETEEPLLPPDELHHIMGKIRFDPDR